MSRPAKSSERIESDTVVQKMRGKISSGKTLSDAELEDLKKRLGIARMTDPTKIFTSIIRKLGLGESDVMNIGGSGHLNLSPGVEEKSGLERFPEIRSRPYRPPRVRGL